MSAPTRISMVIDTIRSRIASGLLGEGDKLPSVRQCAAALHVSPATVVEAYDRMVADGLIEAVPKSGFFVARLATQPKGPAQNAPARPAEIDPFWVSRQSLDADAETEKPGCGWLPPDWMPQDALRRALRSVAADPALLTLYGSTRGEPSLRRQLAMAMAGEGLAVHPDHVLLTGSGTQAIDLICRLMLRPGDAVLLDDPCYFNFQALLAAHSARVVSVPYGPHGPDPAQFEAIVARERPRLYLTNSAPHNPTGACLSPQIAHRLPAIAAAHGMVIVEDDIFADFAQQVPRMAVLDGLQSVIRIGSFSKTLSASLRCGYIMARGDWIDALCDLQVATGFGGPSPLSAAAIAHVLVGGQYRKHIDGLRRRLAGARAELTGQLAAMGLRVWGHPVGGFNLWCALPPGQDSARLAQACRARGVVLAPGNVFSPSQSAGAYLRFNAAQTNMRSLRIMAEEMAAIE
ncbi:MULTISPECIES: aminotransferase-like domain-containing protein [unclassified Novosphingobium]|uniref:aminotransferase-like domain-containing protein n=1 Tax=unclassified Novosphingobium TaxID=2644732 RepID=UPI0008690E7C|nr:MULTISPECIES: PLP-dependent aminotransferase family protein [unclassified Novosphingobium]MBN9146567.1 PLP-dependent aminotransferase family protein [Novosphingobium sp.]MDR6709337.1 DNA-binding transcriptional MocR family regulator [Novosphingobium sp. 1748]ODU78972.1 MAG: GntR family transcriptional regulator [Novosphingobium sp. SCN 63-17]OJX90903.1 MAG: GntR family transcriptional regulator [Novosphingobium sp. 63-713]